MGVRVTFLDLLLGDLGVELRRREVLVSQEFLDHSQVGAAVKKMGREAVTQRMRRGLLVEPGNLDVLLSLIHI